MGRRIVRLHSPSHPKSSLWIDTSISRNSFKSVKRNKKSVFKAAAYEFILYPGDVLVTYPGWSYESWSIDAENTALSMEFRIPAPTKYFEHFKDIFTKHAAFQSRLNSGNLFETCDKFWQQRTLALEEMKRREFSSFLLCESTFAGDCRRFHFEQTGEILDQNGQLEQQQTTADEKTTDTKESNWISTCLVALFLVKNAVKFLQNPNVQQKSDGSADKKKKA